jgi:hypothetical protein
LHGAVHSRGGVGSCSNSGGADRSDTPDVWLLSQVGRSRILAGAHTAHRAQCEVIVEGCRLVLYGFGIGFGPANTVVVGIGLHEAPVTCVRTSHRSDGVAC